MFATKQLHVRDGALLITPNATSRSGIYEELKDMLVKHVDATMIANNGDTKVLTVTGTREDQRGVSSLTDKELGKFTMVVQPIDLGWLYAEM